MKLTYLEEGGGGVELPGAVELTFERLTGQGSTEPSLHHERSRELKSLCRWVRRGQGKKGKSCILHVVS